MEYKTHILHYSIRDCHLSILLKTKGKLYIWSLTFVVKVNLVPNILDVSV